MGKFTRIIKSHISDPSKSEIRVTRFPFPQERLRNPLNIYTFLAMLMLLTCFITSCQPTPEEKFVKDKGSSFLDNLSNQKSENALIDEITANYTNGWQDTIQVKPFNIKVDIKAKIMLPDSSKFSIYEVSPLKITQEQVNSFLGLFGDVEYRLNTLIKTKADYQEHILDRQKYLATNLNEIEDENEKENTRQKVIKGIEMSMQLMQDAPESLDDVIEPVFTNKYLIAQDMQEWSTDESDEVGGKELKSVQEYYESKNIEEINVKWITNGIPMVLVVGRSDDLPFNAFTFLAGEEKYYLNVIENHSDLDSLEIKYDKAEVLAKNAVSKLGLDYMTLAHSAKEVDYNDNYNYNELGDLDDYIENSYVFYFTQNLDGINETYCSNKQRPNDRYDAPWPYANLRVIVDDIGIREIQCSNGGTEIGEKITDNPELLSFEEIKKIAAEQFAIGNISFPRGESEKFEMLNEMELSIEEAVLGYGRVKLANSDKYVMIPVWDFFGSYGVEYEFEKRPFSMYNKN